MTSAGQPLGSEGNIVIHDSGCSRGGCRCAPLELRDSVKYLGIIIDKHLKWEAHILYLLSRLRKIIYKFVQLRNMLPVYQLRMVFLALVQSIIEYGIVGWRGIGSSIMQPLVLLHKKIIKICLKKPIRYPSELVYRDFQVLDIHQLSKFNLLKFVYQRPNEFPVAPEHRYATRGQARENLFEPRYKTTAAAAHSYFEGPRLFNGLPADVSGLSNFFTFKRVLRTIL